MLPAAAPRPEAVVASLRRYFSGQPEVWAAYLFGSVARGTAGPLSDVDVAVLREPIGNRVTAWEERSRYAGDLARLLGRAVDLVLLQEAGDTLSEEILREGQVVLEADRDRHRAFRATRVLRALDFRPVRERAEQGLVHAIRREAHGP